MTAVYVRPEDMKVCPACRGTGQTWHPHACLLCRGTGRVAPIQVAFGQSIFTYKPDAE